MHVGAKVVGGPRTKENKVGQEVGRQHSIMNGKTGLADWKRDGCRLGKCSRRGGAGVVVERQAQNKVRSDGDHLNQRNAVAVL